MSELLDAITKSGQTAPPRETDEQYVQRIMDEVDMDEILPFLEVHPAVEIVSDDVERSFDDWSEESDD